MSLMAELTTVNDARNSFTEGGAYIEADVCATPALSGAAKN
jgi:hypothetical protein